MKLTGNTILITGGGSGIGLALGETFAQRGNHVIAAGRNAQKLKVAERNGLSTVQVDMSDPASIHALAMTVSTEFPRVNVVIHNAAICEPVDFTMQGHEQIREETVATNFLGPMRLTDALLPQLLKQEQVHHDRLVRFRIRALGTVSDMQRNEGRPSLVLAKPAVSAGTYGS
jgi:uncharacterized oxidoreductase